jgi:RNA polymerase sigma-B factor
MSSTHDDHSIAIALITARSASPRERELLESEVVVFFQPMTHALARRYSQRGVDTDDLEQVADLALLKAMRRYDPSSGHLRGYVAATVLGEVKKYFRDHGWMVRPPRDIQDLQSLVMEAAADLHEDVPTQSRVGRIAESLGVSRSVVAEVLIARGGFRCLSLDRTTHDDGPTIADQLSEPADAFTDTDQQLFVTFVCAALRDDDRMLLHLRFVEELSQTQIADRLHSSQKQVSRALERVLTSLRERALSEAA